MKYNVPVILQKGNAANAKNNDCGSACIAMAVKVLQNRDVTVDEVSSHYVGDKMLPINDPDSENDFFDLSRKFGLNWERFAGYATDWLKSAIKDRNLFVIAVTKDYKGHYIVVKGYDDNGVYTNDPMVGDRFISWSTFYQLLVTQPYGTQNRTFFTSSGGGVDQKVLPQYLGDVGAQQPPVPPQPPIEDCCEEVKTKIIELNNVVIDLDQKIEINRGKILANESKIEKIDVSLRDLAFSVNNLTDLCTNNFEALQRPEPDDSQVILEPEEKKKGWTRGGWGYIDEEKPQSTTPQKTNAEKIKDATSYIAPSAVTATAVSSAILSFDPNFSPELLAIISPVVMVVVNLLLVPLFNGAKK